MVQMNHSFARNVDGFGAFVLELQAAAAGGDVSAFQERAMQLLGGMLPFDGGWWGRAMSADGLHRVHCSYVYRLPPDVAERMNIGDPHNLVAQRTTEQPDRALWFGPDDWATQPSTAALAVHMGIAQSLCITRVDASTGVASFVSVVRHDKEPQFDADEQRWLERLTPHLAAALDLCLVAQLNRLHDTQPTTLLATDAEGWLRVAEPGAVTMLRQEWPAWMGPRLPKALQDRIAAGRPNFLGRHLHAGLTWKEEHVFVTLRQRDARDLLTPRERAVAVAFAAGQSYREVAAELGLAPATVRHHLRATYQKLGVSDKAAFATRLAEPGH
jgi:DNA-binding CsgD family transcriptional regulator